MTRDAAAPAATVTERTRETSAQRSDTRCERAGTDCETVCAVEGERVSSTERVQPSRGARTESVPAAVGAVPGAEGLFVAAGHEGSGLLLAPATARLLVRAVLKEEGGGRDAAIHAAADAVSPRRVLEAVEKRRKEETV